MTDKNRTQKYIGQNLNQNGSSGKTNDNKRKHKNRNVRSLHPKQSSARRRAKITAATYILQALEESGMRKHELAEALDISPSRLSQLISVNGDLATETIPFSLLYEVADATGSQLNIVISPGQAPLSHLGKAVC